MPLVPWEPVPRLFWSRTYREVGWIGLEIGLGLFPLVGTLQQLTLPFFSWVTWPSLCVKHQLCVHKREVMVRDQQLLGPFSWGKRSLMGQPLRFWLPFQRCHQKRVASCACTFMLMCRTGGVDAVYGFLMLRCLEQAVASPAIFCGPSAQLDCSCYFINECSGCWEFTKYGSQDCPVKWYP